MLLAIDVGNSIISVGLFGPDRELKFLASIDTDRRKTADQISIDLMNIFSLYGFDLKDVTGAIFSSVVPPILRAGSLMIRRRRRSSCGFAMMAR